jgi:hypothetical protein
MPPSGPTAARTASLRVTQQEYEALKQEANSRGYQLSQLMRHCLFGKTRFARNCERPETDMTLLGDIIGKLTYISGELGTNSTHIHAIAESMDEGFRNAFGLDFCLRLFERLNQDLLKTLTLIDTMVSEQQKLLTRRLREDRTS